MILEDLLIPTIIMSAISVIFSMAAMCMVIGQKLSTHKIEWKPLEIHDPFKIDNPVKDEDEDDKVLEEALAMQRKGKKKEKKEQDPLDEILQATNF